MMETQILVINGPMLNLTLMKIETLKFESQKGSVITVRQNGTISCALPLIASVTWGQKFYAVQARGRSRGGGVLPDHYPCRLKTRVQRCVFDIFQTDRIIIRASQQICIKLQYYSRYPCLILRFYSYRYRNSTCRRAECSPLITFLTL